MRLKLLFGVLALIFSFNDAASSADSPLPVVLWHGMGDTCCFPFSLGSIKKLLEQQLDGVYVKSLKIGGNIVMDYQSGFFIHPNEQVADACRQIAKDERLANGFNAIGFSQGGQFLRAVAERCPSPPIKTLITLGGQHQGVFGLPACPSLSNTVCEHIRKLLNREAYKEWVQRDLVQATYWHDPLNEAKYRSFSTFLSDINNELGTNYEYVENLNKLEKFVLVKFMNDTIVQPKESQWFQFYTPGQDKEIQPLNESIVYKKLGLERLMQAGKMHFLELEGDHLQISQQWFIEHLIPFLRSAKDVAAN